MLVELGEAAAFPHLDQALTPLALEGRPSAMPQLGADEALICIYDRSRRKVLFWCQGWQDMLALYDGARSGGGSVSWYRSDRGFVDRALAGQVEIAVPDEAPGATRSAQVGPLVVTVGYFRERCSLRVRVMLPRTEEPDLDVRVPTPTTIRDLPAPRYIGVAGVARDDVFPAICRLVREISAAEVAAGRAAILRD